jgi:predicted metal-dependent hydrolase
LEGTAVTSDLEVRRIDWQFDPEATPFLWNRAQPGFSQVANAISFVAPPLERYFVSVVRMADARIGDPDAKAEADLFLRQEALHARAHRGHVNALVTQHPGLADLTPALERSFDDLLDAEPLEFHVAYMAGIEATFTPVFRAILEHEDVLFVGGDDHIASLFIWHFVEEIEHRASALAIYREIVRNDDLLIELFPVTFAHVVDLAQRAFAAFREHLPDNVLGGCDDPTLVLAPLIGEQRVDASGAPDPASERVPEIVDRWRAAYNAGIDVREWYAATRLSAEASPSLPAQ